MNISEQILSWIKLSPKYIFPVLLLTGALLFTPAPHLAKFGVDAFVASYRMWIGFVFLASASLLLSHLAFWSKDQVIKRRQARRRLKAAIAALRNLTPEEKAILADFILFQTKSQTLEFQSGVTNGLNDAHIIYRSASVGSLVDGFAYNIQPWAWEELNAHPELLEPELSERRTQLENRRRRGY